MHRKEGKQWPDIHAIYRYQQIYIHIFISLCFHQLEAEMALNPVSSGSVFCSTQFLRCGGSLVAHQTSGAEDLGSNPASTTMSLMRCRIIVK